MTQPEAVEPSQLESRHQIVFRLKLIACALYVFAFLAVIYGLDESTSLRADADNLLQLLAALVAAGVTARAIMQPPSRSRTGWMLISFGCLSWTIGQMIFCWYELVRDLDAPYPTWADLGYNLAPVFFCAGIIVWLSSHTARLWKLIADGCISALVFADFIIAFAMDNNLPSGGNNDWAAVASLTNLTAEVAMMTMATLLVFYTTRARRQVPLLIAFGLLSLSIADIFYEYYRELDTYQTGSIIDVGWGICFVAIAMAARSRETLEIVWPVDEVRPAWRTMLPLASIVVAIAIVGHGHHFKEDRGYAWAFLLVLMFAASVRVYSSAQQNVRMARSLGNTNAALEASEYRYRVVTNAIDNVLFRVDAEGRLSFLNATWERMTGHAVADSLGKPFMDFFVDDDRERAMSQLFNSDTSRTTEEPLELVTIKGVRAQIELTSQPIDADGERHVVGIIRDVTRQKQLERELWMARQRESTARLAGSLAHEVNTPLQSIQNNLQFVKAVRADQANGLVDPDIETEVTDAIIEASEATELVAGIVRALKESTDESERPPQRANINSIIERIVEARADDIEAVAELKLQPGSVNDVVCLEDSVQRAINGIVDNALQAMADSGERGTLTIRTTAAENQTVAVIVVDTGVGIPAKNLNLVFEPFFTTRKVGQGAGLGLTLARNLVESHGGKLWLQSSTQSRVGRPAGTTVILTLPAFQAPTSTVDPATPLVIQ